MIKINLTTTKKTTDLSNVGGFDLTKLRIKPLLIIIALIYVPDFVLIPMWEEELVQSRAQIDSKQDELRKLQNEVNQSQNLEKQIRELKTQEESLGKKLAAVKQAISEKKNPSAILLYIAKNMPQELWIRELSIDNDTMLVKGEAMDYTSIGTFVTNLRSSVFIKDANIQNTNSVVRETDKRRIETFEVRFVIARFDQ